MSEKYYSALLESFKKWAPFYDAFCVPFGSARKAIVAAVRPENGMKALDVCTGTGAVAIELAKAGASVTAIDLSEDMLRRARRKRGSEAIRLLRMDATELMFGPDEFDSATISWGLHEMPLELIRRVLQEMRRVTRRQLVVLDYRQPSSKVLAGIYRSVVGLYEGPFCLDFLNLSIPQLAAEEGLELTAEQSVLLGTCTLMSFRVVK